MTRDQHIAQALEHIRLAAAEHGLELDDAMRELTQAFTALKRAQKELAAQAAHQQAPNGAGDRVKRSNDIHSMPGVAPGRSPPHHRILPLGGAAGGEGGDRFSLEVTT
jgi:hypothetical protein